MKKLILINYLLLVFALIVNAQRDEFPKLTGPYLGQKPPGVTPEVFAPGIISRPDYFEHSAAIFTPDGKEVYWSAKGDNQRYYYIYFMKMVDGIWSKPMVAEFCMENSTYENFALSSDGKKLYFNIGLKSWFVEKQNGVWSKHIPVSSKIDSEALEIIRSITSNNSVYFMRYPEVFVAISENGDYKAPEKLANQINSSDTRINSVYVAPDESYMIIDGRRGASLNELFVSFRMKDNSWSEQIKLPIRGGFPHVSPDGKYLFFISREGIYWVSTKIIKELRPK